MRCRSRADGEVFDYVGGIADIAARRVRFIGDPQQRIAEDYLRILRFFRFHACYGEGAPDAAGLHACIVARAGLDTLSRERVRMELLKLLVAPHATPTLAVMAESGLLGAVLGGVAYLASFENMVKVEAAIGAGADAVRRLGALGVWVAEDAGTACAAAAPVQRRSPSGCRRSIDGGALSPQPASKSAARCSIGWGRSFHRSRIARVVALGRRRSGPAAGTSLRPCRDAGPRRYFRSKPPTFMRRGVAAGPALGAALRAAEEAWIAADFPMDDAAIDAIADRAV